jgi:Tol biopolymer transport system component
MAPEPDDVSNTMIRRFHVARLIARGGMGEVYLATDAVLGRDLALKILRHDVTRDRDRIARFIQEARAASALNHPHLIAIYDIGESAPKRDGEPVGPPVHYIAMELVAGETLRAVIRDKRLSLPRALECLEQVADALDAAHAAGVIHRDLKPENLMISSGGYAKVLDFGVAKLRGEIADAGGAWKTPNATVTTDGVLLGTVGYVSPEQAQGLEIDHRSDVFSFGCVLYEAITGERAFDGPSPGDTIRRILDDEPAPLRERLPGVPEQLDHIVRRCLAKSPARRYQTMREIAHDLREVRAKLEGGDRGGSHSRRSVLVGLSASGALAAIGWWTLAGGAGGTTPAMTIERLTTSGTAIDAAISSDGRYLAWVTSAGGLQALRVRELGGARDVEIVPAARVGYWGIAFSRDNTRIFYSTKSAEQPSGRLFAVSRAGGMSQPVLEGIDSTITLSPDGRQMAFYRAGHPERGATALMIANTDGTNLRALAATRGREFFVPAFFAAPSWSPDGARIAAAIHDGAGGTRLATIDVASGQEQPFGGRFEDATFTAWLPDGSGLLLVASRPAGDREYPRKVWLQPYPGGEPRRITRDLLEYRNASIRGDGRAFVSVGLDAAYSLWRVPLDGGSLQRIASERYDGLLGLAPLPDGRIVVSAGERGNTQLAVLDSTGATRRPLTTDGVNLWPAVAPDGRTLVFVSNREGRTGIWRMSVDAPGADRAPLGGAGRNARLLTQAPDPTWLSVTPDGRSVIYASLSEGETSTWRVPIDGGAPTLVAAGLDRPAVSPDGRFVAGITVRPDAPQLRLVVLPLAGGANALDLGTIAPATGNGLLEWNAAGDGVLFSTVERTNAWLQPLTGGPPRKITDLTDLGIVRGRRAADGKSLIVARGAAQTDAYVISNFR